MSETFPVPSSARLPVLFVSHGSPMFALQPGSTGPALQTWGNTVRARYPHLRGIVILSPHWMAGSAEVMAHPQPPTWHDFGGFPPALYALQYPALGDPALAEEVLTRLQAQAIPSALNHERPLDHGAWVPLRHLFPDADVPVVQVALPMQAGPQEVFAMGRALQCLRDQGVLIIGSGSMTHNLREFFRGERATEAYVVEFSRWVESKIVAGETEVLLDWQNQAPHALRAHPTDEHFLPLYFALGAGYDADTVEYLSREVMYGILAMDALTWQGSELETGGAGVGQ